MANVYVNIAAGFGNNLFQIACGEYLASLDNNVYYAILPNDEPNRNRLEQQFPQFHFLKMDEINGHSNVLMENTSITYTPINLVSDNDNFISGFRQSPKYWNNDKNIVSKIFDFNNQEILSIIKNTYPDINFNEYVCVHVRTYLHDVERRSILENIGMLEASWFQKAMNNFPSETKFFFVSDNIEYVKENFPGHTYADRPINNPNIKRYVELLIPTLCKHNIISNSTFTWWGAYMNQSPQRKVIAPYPFFKKNSAKDIYPENDNWTLLESEFKPALDKQTIKAKNVYRILLGRPGETIYSKSQYVDKDLRGVSYIDFRKYNLESYKGYERNEHHFTTRSYYDIIIPEIANLLKISFNKNDFTLVKYSDEFSKFDLSYLKPKENFQFQIETNNSDKECGNYDILLGKYDSIREYGSNFHRLYKGAHVNSIIINQTIDNKKTLLLSGDSHLIPLVPILACYYHKIVCMDNRTNVSYLHYFIDEIFDDCLLEYWEGCDVPNKVLGQNLR